MVDKLILLSYDVSPRFEKLALTAGERRAGYSGVIDLQNTAFKLPARLYCRGFYNGINKLEFIGVATLGRDRVLQITEMVFGRTDSARIFRIDLCLDVAGKSVEYFMANCIFPGVQNYKIHRNRGAVSCYPQISAKRTTLFYDKLAELKANHKPRPVEFGTNDTLTRIEVQLKGDGVPFQKLKNLHKYSEIRLLANLRWLTLKTEPNPRRAAQFLAQAGLRNLIRTEGLQRVSKMFTPPVWASIRQQYLEPMKTAEKLPLNSRLQKSVKRWLKK